MSHYQREGGKGKGKGKGKGRKRKRKRKRKREKEKEKEKEKAKEEEKKKKKKKKKNETRIIIDGAYRILMRLTLCVVTVLYLLLFCVRRFVLVFLEEEK